MLIHLLSDLHLPPGPSPLREGFLRYLSGEARNASKVFILGDLFEYWVGDDAGLRDHGSEAKAIRALVNYGVPVAYQHGNRDFMLGKRYAEAAGMTLLPEAIVETLGGVPTLLAHGDQYCTDDVKYQKWRRFSRNPVAQWVYRALPESQRQKIAGDLRSDKHKQQKMHDIMDVNAEAIAQAFRQHGVTRMIHGHTHRPAQHRIEVDGKACERIVLADWTTERMEVLEISAQGLKRSLI